MIGYNNKGGSTTKKGFISVIKLQAILQFIDVFKKRGASFVPKANNCDVAIMVFLYDHQ